MKRKIIMIIILVMIITSIIILLNQYNELKIKNSDLIDKLEEKNIIKEGKINLEDIILKKQELEDYLTNNFKEENIKQKYETNKQINKELSSSLIDLENEIKNLDNNIDNLEKEYIKLLNEYQKPNTYYIENVPIINQYPNYPTGCESVALTILLRYYGVSVTPDEIISSLDKGPRPYSKNGTLYGANPELEFVGTPYSSHSFGVYEKPISKVANKYKEGINIATGTEFNDILKIVSTGTPVLAWTSMNLIEPYISMSWIYAPTGERIYWKANEHAVVIIGYTEDNVIISDPIGGKIKYQSLSTFRARYNYYGKKALYY